jgi:bifunctional non-homologous end joining protein LigD
MHSVVKTSGATGLHVLVPLDARHDYESAKLFAELIARRVAKKCDEVTLERSVRQRPRGTVYVDYVQVGRGKTIVAPFTVRARPGAPVSMPIAWRTVEAMQRSAAPETTAAMRKWTMRTVPDLLEEHGDPWRRAWKAQRIERAVERAAARGG